MRGERERHILAFGTAEGTPEFEAFDAYAFGWVLTAVVRYGEVYLVQYGSGASQQCVGLLELYAVVSHETYEHIFALLERRLELERHFLLACHEVYHCIVDGGVGGIACGARRGAQLCFELSGLIGADGESHLGHLAEYGEEGRSGVCDTVPATVGWVAAEGVGASGTYFGDVEQVGVIAKLGHGYVLADFRKGFLKLRYHFGSHVVGGFAFVFYAQGESHAYRLASACRSAHHARRAVCHVRGAGDASAEHEIVDMVAEIAAVGYLVYALGVPLVAGAAVGVYTVGWMEVYSPAAVRYCVVVGALPDDILLREGVETKHAARLSLAGDGAHPLEGIGSHFGEVARVLDVVPDAVDHFPQLALDFFGVVDCVEPATVFNPPVLASVMVDREVFVVLNLADMLCHVFERKFGREVLDGLARVFHVEKNSVAHQLAVGILVGAEALVVHVFVFRAHAEWLTGEVAHEAVAAAVGEE